MVRRFAPRFIVWLTLSVALACGRRGAPVRASDELIVATPGDPDSSRVGSERGLHPVNANVYETLVRLTPDFRVAPQLATRWQPRSRNTWRFHLRPGVRMHDGTTLTAAAVVWTRRGIARGGGGPLGEGARCPRGLGRNPLPNPPPRPGRRPLAHRAHPPRGLRAPRRHRAAAPPRHGPRPAIRRAIVYALDRPRLVEAAWRGTAEPAQLLGPAELLGRSAELVAGARSDPRRARRLLDGAGWPPLPDGIRAKAGRRLALTLVIGPPDFDIHRVMATVVQDQLREAGIDLRIVQLPDSGAYRARIKSGAGDLWTVAGDLNDADPCFVADLAVRGGARRYLDACRAAVALDDAQRSAARALRVLIDEESVVVPLAGADRGGGRRREGRGLLAHPASPSQRWDRVSLATNRVSR